MVSDEVQVQMQRASSYVAAVANCTPYFKADCSQNMPLFIIAVERKSY